MHPAEINCALKMRGYSQKKLADELDVSPSAVCNVIYGRDRSRKIELAIGEILDLPLWEIFPQWYSCALNLVA